MRELCFARALLTSLEVLVFLFPVVYSSDTFAEDFFLTHPAFMTTRELCEQMRKVYHGEHDKKKAELNMTSVVAVEEQDKLRKRR